MVKSINDFYKVGDTVLVRSDLKSDGTRYYTRDKTNYAVATKGMAPFSGKIVKIRRVVQIEATYKYFIEGDDCYWTDEMFVGLYVPEEELFIDKQTKTLYDVFGIKRVIVKDNAVIVFFHDGTKFVEKAKHGDELDVRIGIALAYAHKTAKSKNKFNKMVVEIME